MRSRPYIRMLLAGCLILAWPACSFGGQVGHFTLRTKGKAAAHIMPDFRPVAGPILHLRADGSSTARAECEIPDLQPPYELSYWFYVTLERYDDLVIYQAADGGGEPTDITVMLREAETKMPPSPDDWHGMVWVKDAGAMRSVCNLRRPGWHRVRIARKSEREVSLAVNGEVIGTYQARSPRPASRIELGDLSSTDGSGEAYWGRTTIRAGEGPDVSLDAWKLAATGTGAAEQGLGFDEVRTAHLYLRRDASSSCDAQWGPVEMEVPYQFWCQVYVSESPYQHFNVICPLDGEGQPTDLQVEFNDGEAGAAGEAPAEGFVWVVDAEGRHNVGSITRGVWHELTIRRRKEHTVDLLIDGVPVKTCPSRSTKPVASYRFGDFDADSSAGEAYWYKIRLLKIPRE